MLLYVSVVDIAVDAVEGRGGGDIVRNIVRETFLIQGHSVIRVFQPMERSSARNKTSFFMAITGFNNTLVNFRMSLLALSCRLKFFKFN